MEYHRLINKSPITGICIGFVEEIYDHAKAENNGSQLIKSLIYLSKLNIAMLEDGEMQAIELFKSEIRTANAPVKIFFKVCWQKFMKIIY